MYSENDYRSYELFHHGVLGQKWGKRNGPPYPLDVSDHSASEKKAGWRKSLEQNKEIRERIGRAQSAASLEKRINKLEGKYLTESRQKKIDALVAKRNTKISDLSENELELGRRYLERDELLNTTSLAGMIIAGTPGMLVANLGTSVIYGLTKEGKATSELAKKVKNENNERMAKRDAELNNKPEEKSISSFKTREEAEKYSEQRYRDDFKRAQREKKYSEEEAQLIREANRQKEERNKEINKTFGKPDKFS